MTLEGPSCTTLVVVRVDGGQSLVYSGGSPDRKLRTEVTDERILKGGEIFLVLG